MVLRFTAHTISNTGATVRAEAGAELQALVDYSIEHGLRGLETMTGIPGSVGAAVYGNAGAYGHSIDERVELVRFLDGDTIRNLTGAGVPIPLSRERVQRAQGLDHPGCRIEYDAGARGRAAPDRG